MAQRGLSGVPLAVRDAQKLMWTNELPGEGADAAYDVQGPLELVEVSRGEVAKASGAEGGEGHQARCRCQTVLCRCQPCVAGISN